MTTGPLQSESYQDGQHPDADHLTALVENCLSAHEQQAIVGHLAACSRCRKIVALSLPAVEALPTFEPKIVSRTEGKSWPTSWVVAWFTVPILVSAILLAIHQRNERLRQSPARMARLSPPQPALPPPRISIAQSSVPQSIVEPQPGAPAKSREVPVKTPPTVHATPATSAPQARQPVVAQQTVPSSAPASRGALALSQRSPAIVRPDERQTSSRTALPGTTHRRSASPLKDRPAIPPASYRSSPTTVPAGQEASLSPKSPGRYERPSPPSAATASPATSDATAHSAPAPAPVHVNPVPVYSVNADPSRRSAYGFGQPRLPSGLPALSLAVHLEERVAIDSGNQAFSSEDAGQHWRAIPSPWRGRAVEVSMVPRTGPDAQPVAFAVPERFTPGEAAVVESDSLGNSVNGTITDAAGKPIPRAMLILTDSRTAQARTSETDSSGRYVVANFVPGLYRLDVRAPGFMTQSLLVDLSSTPQTSRNVHLEAGQGPETVGVDASNSPEERSPARASGAAKTMQGVSRTSPGQASSSMLFVVATDTGERWTSANGQTWKPE